MSMLTGILLVAVAWTIVAFTGGSVLGSLMRDPEDLESRDAFSLWTASKAPDPVRGSPMIES